MSNLKVNKQRVRIAAALVSIIILGACQKTPDELIVQSKADELFEEAVQETAEEAIDATMKAEHINQTFISESAKTTVIVDADVVLPDVEQIPVAEIDKKAITQKELDRIVMALTKGGELYDPTVVTRERIEAKIIQIKQESTNLESDLAQSNGITNMIDLEEYADERIAELEKQLADAPSEASIDTAIDSIDVSSESVYLKADLGNAYDAELFYWNTMSRGENEGDRSQGFEYLNFGKINFWRELDSFYATEVDDVIYESREYQTAYDVAMKLMDQMQIGDIELTQTFRSADSSDASSGELGERIYYADKEYYVFVFSRVINGVPIASAFYEGGGDDGNQPMYSRPIYNEVLEVWFDGGDVVQFFWKFPVRTASVINENVKINIDLNQAVELMGSRMNIVYNPLEFVGPKYEEDVVDIIVEIDKIELALAGLREKDNQSGYIASPVWDFYGKVKIKYSDEYYNQFYLLYPSEYLDEDGYVICNLNLFKSICTVNALDGTIVDRDLGY